MVRIAVLPPHRPNQTRLQTSPCAMIANPDQVPLSAAAYLAWEEQQELRYEYLDGRVYPRNDILGITGGTLPHNDIALNLYTALRPFLRQRGCRVNVADRTASM